MIRIAPYRTREDAELAQAALEAADIPSVLEADDAGGAYPLTAAARLVIADADAGDADSGLSGRPSARGEDGIG